MSAIASPYNLVAAASMPITSAAVGAFAAAAGVAQRGLASSSTAQFGLDSHDSNNNNGSGGSGWQPYYPPNPNLGAGVIPRVENPPANPDSPVKPSGRGRSAS